MLFEISKNLGNNSVNYYCLKNKPLKNQNIWITDKTKIREKISLQKINQEPMREIKSMWNIKKMTHENKSTAKITLLKLFDSL